MNSFSFPVEKWLGTTVFVAEFLQMKIQNGIRTNSSGSAHAGGNAVIGGKFEFFRQITTNFSFSP